MVDRRAQLWALVQARRGRPARWAAAVCAVAAGCAGVDGAPISLRSGPNQELVASAGPLAARLDELQYIAGEGPSVEAFELGAPVLVADVLDEDGRWPGFTTMAGDVGLGAVFAFPLRAGAIKMGTLVLYRDRAGPLTAEQLRDATILTELAVVVLLDEYDNAEPRQPLFEDQYDQVNLAIGMVAAQLRISVSDASARLRSYAFGHHRSLNELAQDIISNRLRLDEPSE